jgi:hypothetical protein
MSTCPATRLAWSIWVFSDLFGATALVTTFLGVPAGLSFLEFAAAFNAAVIAAFFSTVGVMVASRRPEILTGWLMCAEGLFFVLNGLGRLLRGSRPHQWLRTDAQSGVRGLGERVNR